MSLEEPMVSASTPGSWQATLAAWAELLATLAAIVGEKGPALDADGLAAVIDRLHFLTWAWMLTLTPCSMARKAAFELGVAATLVARWQAARCCAVCEDPSCESTDGLREVDAGIGTAAEEALRIVARQFVDVRAETEAIGLGHAPDMAPSVRLYYSCLSTEEIVQDFLRHVFAPGRQLGRVPVIRRHLEALLADVLPDREPGAPGWLLTSEDLLRFDGTLA